MQSRLPLFVFSLGVFVLFAQLTQLTYFASQAADSRSMIAALNNDAANAIDVAGKSQLFRDNGFAGYGPVYFRLANVMASVFSPLTESGGWNETEGRTKAIHFALLMVSVLGLVGLALWLSYGIAGKVEIWPLLAAALAFSFLRSTVWQKFLLIAHPDHLLALVVAVACGLSFRSWVVGGAWHRYSAWAWGVAMATKMSVVLFYPFALLGFFLMARARWPELVKWIGHSLLAYFIVGIPQNFNIPRTLRFLSFQSQFSQKATWSSLVEWMQIYGAQMIGPLIVVMVLVAIVRRKWRVMNEPRLWVSTGALSIAPMILMFAQNINAPHDHYPMPLVSAQLTLLVALLTRYSQVALLNFATATQRVLPAVGLGLFMYLGVVPPSLNETLAGQLRCRPEARVVYSALTEFVQANKKVYGDPYVPALNKMPNVRSVWTPTINYMVDNAIDVIVLNKNHHQQYFTNESMAYIGTYNKTIDATQAFYSLFRGVDRLRDEKMGSWRREFADVKCGWEIWVKE